MKFTGYRGVREGFLASCFDYAFNYEIVCMYLREVFQSQGCDWRYDRFGVPEGFCKEGSKEHRLAKLNSVLKFIKENVYKDIGLEGRFFKISEDEPVLWFELTVECDYELVVDKDKILKCCYNDAYILSPDSEDKPFRSLPVKFLRKGRVVKDLQDVFMHVVSQYGFFDDSGSGLLSNLKFEVVKIDLDPHLKYSIACESAEVAQDFAEKWVSFLENDSSYRYAYISATMIDPLLLQPNYFGVNRIFWDPSVLVGLINIDDCLKPGDAYWDKSLSPFES